MRKIGPLQYYSAAVVLAASVLALLWLDKSLPKLPNKYQEQQRAVVSVKPKSGEGSGFVIKRTNPAGQTRLFVWTAAHVVDNETDFAPAIEQVLRNENHKVGKTVFKARLILRSDTAHDCALLWLDAPPQLFKGVEFDGIDTLDIGDSIYHIGNFRGQDLDNSFSTGVFSQFGAEVEGWPWAGPLDQSTTLIVPGSSGGPVFNFKNDKIVGIAVGWGGIPGITFFVPMRTLAPFVYSRGFEWAIAGDHCPIDATLISYHEALKPKAKPPELKPVVIEIKKEVTKKPFKRFTFRGW